MPPSNLNFMSQVVTADPLFMMTQRDLTVACLKGCQSLGTPCLRLQEAKRKFPPGRLTMWNGESL